jgi:hypothetical protein
MRNLILDAPRPGLMRHSQMPGIAIANFRVIAFPFGFTIATVAL